MAGDLGVTARIRLRGAEVLCFTVEKAIGGHSAPRSSRQSKLAAYCAQHFSPAEPALVKACASVVASGFGNRVTC
jgi:predicted NAD/FAD-dependent oxidoreductase